MGKQIILNIVATMALLIVAACASEACLNEEWDTLYQFEKSGLWGFKDAYDNVVIEPRFGGVSANGFSEGFTIIRGIPGDPEMKGFIDLTGELVIPLPSIVGIVSGFSDGFALIIEREWDWSNEQPNVTGTPGPFVYIDRSGRNVFSQEFEYATRFNEGFAVVSPAGENMFFINRQGQNAFDMEFLHAVSFVDGYAEVQLLDRRWVSIDRNGDIVG